MLGTQLTLDDFLGGLKELQKTLEKVQKNFQRTSTGISAETSAGTCSSNFEFVKLNGL